MLIHTNKGDFVNLDTVQRVRQLPRSARGTEGARFLEEARRDGAVVIPEDIGDPERLSSPLLPSEPAPVMICISATGEVTAAPIAWWRVCRTGLEPLFVIEPPAGATRFLAIGGHGLVRLDDGAILPTLESAKAATVGVTQDHSVETSELEIEQPKAAAAGRRR